VKRPAFWILLGVVSVAAAGAAWHFFPQAFSIVALDITMDREAALAAARALATQDGLGPPGYRQAASFTVDEEAQTFVELEGGGKEALTRMLRDGLYFSYTWRVRHFREGETNETLLRFTPDGRPYGFSEKLKEDAPGAELDAADARRRAEADARAKWQIDFASFGLVEQGQERRPGRRIDHTFTYERAAPALNEGRYRLRLVVSGDRLTEVTHFIRIPEAFTRRYQNMRSANEAIGIGSVVGMMLLYVVGGIGVGLFYMLRKRWVLWRQAALWGVVVALMQALATVNQWPLMWMTYDTAVPRATFLSQQIATVFAMFLGFSISFALSFMAAETLTRRAFGSHPQFWRVWKREPGSSKTILGQTAAGYLLVPIFFAYDVLLYLTATRAFGWWTPSEALLHPDVLATHVPWLSAIANSLQAGFWEECLFRAIPIAGAALIGDRFGHRRSFIVVAFLVQALIFGAGHAPYPAQPSFARPVELILPSIGFGLLYVYFGLLPGIILHFAFDVVWFALPIFLAKAPGIWMQQVMVVVMTLVPLGIVLFRRIQVGRWTELPDGERNAAWTPPPAPERAESAPVVAGYTIGDRTRTIWLGVGAACLVACTIAVFVRERPGSLAIRRTEAAAIAREGLGARGVTLGPEWRILPTPLDGTDGPHEFVTETAGDERRKTLLGTYLPAPGWYVRAAKFEGDVADRAEEWQIAVSAARETRIQHLLPEGRQGASLDESAARQIAQDGLAERTGLEARNRQAREISARPRKVKARTDWTFTFADTTVTPLPQGEMRIDVVLAGDEVARVGRYIHVPEDWERARRAADTRNRILRIVTGVVFGGLLVAAAVLGVIMWSRGRYAPRLFFGAAALMLVASIADGANGWPSLLASLQTALPLPLQILGVIGIGLVALTFTSSLAGLAIGALPHRLANAGGLADRDALRLGIAAGLFGAAVSFAAAAFRTPDWAAAPAVGPLGSYIPVLAVAIDPIAGFITRLAVLGSLLAFVHVWTAGWTRRRVPGAIALAAAGLVGAGAPAGMHAGGWALGGFVSAAGLLVAFVTLLRADLTMVPVALGTMMAIGVLAGGAGRPFPGALAGSILGAILLAALSWWWFRALRRARARIA
jgi:hypothetical protein